jgi:hypothetical protein
LVAAADSTITTNRAAEIQSDGITVANSMRAMSAGGRSSLRDDERAVDVASDKEAPQGIEGRDQIELGDEFLQPITVAIDDNAQAHDDDAEAQHADAARHAAVVAALETHRLVVLLLAISLAGPKPTRPQRSRLERIGKRGNRIGLDLASLRSRVPPGAPAPVEPRGERADEQHRDRGFDENTERGRGPRLKTCHHDRNNLPERNPQTTEPMNRTGNKPAIAL